MGKRTNPDVYFALALLGLCLLALGCFWTGYLVGKYLPSRQVDALVIAALPVVLFLGLIVYLVAYKPVAMLKAKDRELARVSTIDPMTDLLNRVATLDHLTREVNRATRTGEALSLGIVELDNLEDLVDQFGEGVKDTILRSIGNLINGTRRQYDVAGRYGNNDFLLIYPGTRLDNAARAADRLRHAIQEMQFAHNGHGFSVTASMGLTQVDSNHPETIDEMIQRVDKALARIKALGGNGIYAQAPLAVVEQAG